MRRDYSDSDSDQYVYEPSKSPTRKQLKRWRKRLNDIVDMGKPEKPDPKLKTKVQPQNAEVYQHKLLQSVDKIAALQSENKILKEQLAKLHEGIQTLTRQNGELILQVKALNDSKNVSTPPTHTTINTTLAQSTPDVEMELAAEFPPLPLPKPNPNHPKTTNTALQKAQQKQNTPTTSHNTQKTHNTQNTQDNTLTKPPKTVPIVIREGNKYLHAMKMLKENNVKILETKKSGLGIQIFPDTSDDHRKATKILTQQKIEYHTYFLPEDRKLNIIIKGLDINIDIEDIKNDITDKGYDVIECYRLKNSRNQKTSHVKILLPKTQDSFYNERHICYMPVTIEAQRHSTVPPQCKNCQKFGHSMVNCNASPRCHKCAGSHYHLNCPNKNNNTLKCANCNGPHAANHSKCPRNPRNKPATQTTTPQNNTETPKPRILDPSKTKLYDWSKRTQTQQSPPVNTQQNKPQTTYTPIPQTPNNKLIELLTLSPEEMKARVELLAGLIKNNPILSIFNANTN